MANSFAPLETKLNDQLSKGPHFFFPFFGETSKDSILTLYIQPPPSLDMIKNNII